VWSSRPDQRSFQDLHSACYVSASCGVLAPVGEPVSDTFDPGPCPNCEQRNYRINWLGTGTGDDPYAAIPGTVTCLNPECPGRIENEDGQAVPSAELCSGWDNADA
jgi:hypothetical protein